MKNIILIDFDRTLMYLYPDKDILLELSKIICDHYNKYIDVNKEYYKMDGYRSWYKLHQEINSINITNKEEINALAEELVTNFEIEVIKKNKFMNGVINTLSVLKENNILGIVSNNSKDAIEYALRKEGIREYFKVIVGRPNPFDPNKIKPSPNQLIKAIELININNYDNDSKIYYLGDAVNDILAAKNASILSIGIATGKYTKEELIKAGANICVECFSEILNYIS